MQGASTRRKGVMVPESGSWISMHDILDKRQTFTTPQCIPLVIGTPLVYSRTASARLLGISRPHVHRLPEQRRRSFFGRMSGVAIIGVFGCSSASGGFTMHVSFYLDQAVVAGTFVEDTS